MKYKSTEIYNSIKDHLSEHSKTIKNAMLISLVTIIIAITGCGLAMKRTDLWRLEDIEKRYGYQMDFNERVYGEPFERHGGMGAPDMNIGNVKIPKINVNTK